jgi:hypothetical protein
VAPADASEVVEAADADVVVVLFEETGVRETVGMVGPPAAPARDDLLRFEDEFTVDSCNCISIIWSPRRIVRFRGALPLRKSTT